MAAHLLLLLGSQKRDADREMAAAPPRAGAPAPRAWVKGTAAAHPFRQCGNQICGMFSEVICGEHDVDSTGRYSRTSPQQLEWIKVYNDSGGRPLRDRVVLIDLELGTMESIRAGPFGGIFRPTTSSTTSPTSGTTVPRATTSRAPSSSMYCARRPRTATTSRDPHSAVRALGFLPEDGHGVYVAR